MITLLLIHQKTVANGMEWLQ